jgi:hypothetical protein
MTFKNVKTINKELFKTNILIINTTDIPILTSFLKASRRAGMFRVGVPVTKIE